MALHPHFKWADNDERVFITVLCGGTATVRIQEDSLELSLETKDDPPSVRELRVVFRAPIDVDESSWNATDSAVVFSLAKKHRDGVKWPSLQPKGVPKPPNERIDWDLYQFSEDSSDDEEDERTHLHSAASMMNMMDPGSLDAHLDGMLGELPEPEDSSFDLAELLLEDLPRPVRACASLVLSIDFMDVLLFLLSVAYVCACPYTKVEESFNTQAMHDVLHHTTDVSQYDHLEFPGVVPRTFLGPIGVSTLCFPWIVLLELFGMSKWWGLLVTRSCLAFIGLVAFKMYRNSVAKAYGWATSIALAGISASQFHFLFYLSRPLPNVFALAVVHAGLSWWVAGRRSATIAAFAFGAVVFRSELVLLFAPLALVMVAQRSPSIGRCVAVGMGATLCSVALTTAVDSVVWRRVVWPEAEVFYFNTILNRSSEWGTSPAHWYFTSALPRMLLGAAALVPIGLLLDGRRMAALCWPALAFVAAYSALPHKELRFILYALPLLNTIAAQGLAMLVRKRHKGTWYAIASIAALLLLCASLAISLSFVYVSAHNYPGGHALARLHRMHHGEQDAAQGGDQDAASSNSIAPSVHIDVLSAMTGVSRFCQVDVEWRYSKEEGLTHDEKRKRFDYILSEEEVEGFQTMAIEYGFAGVSLSFPPRIRTKPMIYIQKRIK